MNAFAISFSLKNVTPEWKGFTISDIAFERIKFFLLLFRKTRNSIKFYLFRRIFSFSPIRSRICAIYLLEMVLSFIQHRNVVFMVRSVQIKDTLDGPGGMKSSDKLFPIPFRWEAAINRGFVRLIFYWLMVIHASNQPLRLVRAEICFAVRAVVECIFHRVHAERQARVHAARVGPGPWRRLVSHHSHYSLLANGTCQLGGLWRKWEH